MATSGSFSNTFKTGWTLVVEWVESNVDTANNQSDITVTAKLKTASGYTINSSASKNISLTINGTTYSSTCNVGIGSGTTKTLWSKTVSNINHNSDGAKTISITCKLGIAVTLSGQYISSVSATGSAKLTTIARKSTMSVGNGTLNTAQTLTVTRQSSSFTHTITAKCGSASTTICTKSSSTNISFTPPLSWASQNTTGSSVSVTYTITTYNGNTSVGSNSYTKTCSIPASVKPTITSLGISDPTGNYDVIGAYVQSKSKFKIVVAASGSQGSTIKSYKTTADGKTYTSSTITTDVISGSGTLTITATITDSRGRTATASESISVLPYSSPTINSISVARSDVNGNSSSSGAYLTVKFKSTVTALNSKNTSTYTLKYKKSTETSYASVTLSDYKDVYSVTDGKHTFSAETGSSYNVELTVADKFSSAKKTTFGSSVKKLWSALKKGLGFAFGKVAELQNYLDVGFKTIFRDQVEFVNDKSIMGTDTDGTKYSALIPVSASGNTSLGYGLYKAEKGNTHIYGNKVQFYTNDGIYANGNHLYFGNNRCLYGTKPNGDFYEVINLQNASGNLVFGYDNYDNKNGLTNIYGYDVHFGVSNIASPGTFKPYFRQGDTISVNIQTAGYITNSKTELHFTIPLNKPVVGTPTISLSSNNGFVLRQEDKYTHGSGATTYVKPSSYTAYAYHGVGVRVVAVFSATTNALNNSPIGIHWEGTITLS